MLVSLTVNATALSTLDGRMTGPMWMPSAAPDLLRLVRWHPQPIPVVPVLCLLLAAAYAWGVVHLRRSGHSWSPGRCVSWAAGLATILAVTATGIGGYGMELFSVHMAQHMVLSMLSPLLLVMAAPLTLALRALPARGGAGGLRRVLLVMLHSRAASALTAPALTLPLFIVSLYGLYFTPLFDAAMRSWFWHDWMLLHFVAVGLLLFWPILAIDPSPRTTSPVLRIIELFMAMPFHAFFGIAVMTSTTLLVRTFALPYPPWRTGALADQHLGGGIAWAFSEIPTLLVVAVIFVRWSRSSDREARRLDRAASRDGDKALLAYNAWLARLAALDRGDGGGNPA